MTARWEQLILLNYRCPEELLAPLVPQGTELDPWHGQHYVSLVGFMFRDARLFGLPIPFHGSFEEVNLRFYIRRRMEDGTWRRGVVFIRELVAKPAVTFVAKRVYNESYFTVPMNHRIANEPNGQQSIEYGLQYQGNSYRVGATVTGEPAIPVAGSLAEYITEHYWGYTRQRDGGTCEYEVQHPQWPVWNPEEWFLTGPMTGLYGAGLGGVLSGEPESVLVSPGSAVKVYRGHRLPTETAAHASTVRRNATPKKSLPCG